MNKEKLEQVNNEIEKYKLSGRRERRQVERQLQKKYNDKSIRIKSGKKFNKSPGLNKEKRRNLVKNKDLVKEIMKIIMKYLPLLMPMFSELTDKRNKSYIKFNMKTIIITRLFALICGITTMKGINNSFNKDEAIKNLSVICNQTLKNVPDWQTVQDVIEDLSIDEINSIRKYIVTALIRSKMFDRYRYRNCIQLLVDVTGLTSLDYNLNGTCLTRTKNGTTKYFKYVLEAKIVFGNIVISLDSD